MIRRTPGNRSKARASGCYPRDGADALLLSLGNSPLMSVPAVRSAETIRHTSVAPSGAYLKNAET